MKLQAYLNILIPLIGSLPFTYADPAFVISQMSLQSAIGDAGPWSYSVNLKPYIEDDSKIAVCVANDPYHLIGEERMNCTRNEQQLEPGSRRLTTINVDLVNELDVRIQQPDNGNPTVGGFGVLIAWG